MKPDTIMNDNNSSYPGRWIGRELRQVVGRWLRQVGRQETKAGG